MDGGYSRAVIEVFTRLYDKGLIYRGNYIINWCPRCQTALSDEEAEHDELKGALYYIRYPVAGEAGHITVATTRPETMLGDVAVAVNPNDPRHRGLVGKELILPIVERRLAVIEDDFVDPEFGTGIVKVTPAHDPNDFEMGLRHNLEPVNVMNGDGTMNGNVPVQYRGMDRLECRETLLVDLKERGLLEKVVPHTHSAGHCYRCHTLVEPRLSLRTARGIGVAAGVELDGLHAERGGRLDLLRAGVEKERNQNARVAQSPDGGGDGFLVRHHIEPAFGGHLFAFFWNERDLVGLHAAGDGNHLGSNRSLTSILVKR